MNVGGYLDFLFTELAAIVFKTVWFLPGTLSSLTVIVIVITVLDRMFNPHTSSAAWKSRNSPLESKRNIEYKILKCSDF